MQQNILSNFNISIRWNTFESLIYQAIFCIHQVLLYNTCNSTLYGSVGVFFSIIYLTIGLSNLGASNIIAPFIKYATKSKEHCYFLFGQHVLTQLAITFIASIIAGIFSIYIVPSALVRPFVLPLLTTSLVFSESLKRILRTLLQSIFYNKVTSIIQVSSIITYFVSFWIYHSFFQTTFTFISIVTPWIIISIISTSILLYFCVDWYTTLPQTQDTDMPYHLQKRTLSARWSNAILGLIGQLFSRNAMVTLCTIYCGLEAVASIKIITYVLNSVVSLFRNIFQKPSAALLGWNKGSTTKELQVFTYIFKTIKYHPMSYGMIFCGALYYLAYLFMHTEANLSPYSLILLLMLCVIENVQIMYESFFLNKERADLLIILYTAVLVSTIIFFLIIDNISQLTFLIVILTARLIACLSAAILSKYLWRLDSYEKVVCTKNLET